MTNNLTTRQKDLWLELLKFNPTPDHLKVFDDKIKTAIKYQETLKGLTMGKLTPIWQAAKKHRDEQPITTTTTATTKGALDPVLKKVWEDAMDFTPTPLHLTFLEAYLAKELDLDGHFKKVTVETLIEIIREVATGQPKPKGAAPGQPAQSAQPGLPLEAK